MTIVNESLVLEGQIQTNNLDARAFSSRADLNVVGRQAILFRIPVTAVGDTNVIMQQAVRIIDVWAVKTGGAGAGGDTVAVTNTAAAITGAISTNIADTTIARTAAITRANADIAVGGTLRVTGAGAATCAAIVYVLAVRNSGV